MNSVLDLSAALWNRDAFDPASDETLAQVLDRGSVADWRELYRLMETDAGLRRRVKSLVARVPLPLPHFWLAALASLGESVDYDAPLPDYAASLV